MKKTIVALMMIGSASFAGSQKVDLLCQQDEGDHWYEVGVSLVDGGGAVNAKVVEHTDDDKAKLVYNRNVSFERSAKREVYSNSTLRLVVFNSTSAKPTALFSLLKDGPGSVSKLKMRCYKYQLLKY